MPIVDMLDEEIWSGIEACNKHIEAIAKHQRLVATGEGNPPDENARLLSRHFRSPRAMEADGVAARPTARPVLNEIAPFARREDAKAEACEIVVPDEVVR